MRWVRSERGRVDRVALITIVLLVVVIGGGYVFLRLTADDDSAQPAAQPTAKPSHHVKPQSSPSPTPSKPAYDANNPDVGKVVVVSSDHDTTSDKPGVPYWSDADGKGALHDADGTTTPLSQRPATFVHDLLSGSNRSSEWGVLTVGSKPRFLWVDGSGALQANLPSVPGGLIGTADGKRYAVITQSGLDGGSSPDAWTVLSEFPCSDVQKGCDKTSGARSELPSDPRTNGGRLDGFLPNGQVLLETGQGKLAAWDTGAGQPGHELTTLAGSYAAGGPSSRETGRYAAKSSDACWGVATYPKKPLSGWKTCYAAIGGFSADGSKVVLTGDGYHFAKGSADDAPEGPATLWIRKASDNSPVVVYTAPKGGFFTSWAWDGDVLDAVLYEPGTGKDPGTWSLLRLGATSYQVQDGLQAVTGDDPDSPPIVLPRS